MYSDLVIRKSGTLKHEYSLFVGRNHSYLGRHSSKGQCYVDLSKYVQVLKKRIYVSDLEELLLTKTSNPSITSLLSSSFIRFYFPEPLFYWYSSMSNEWNQLDSSTYKQMTVQLAEQWNWTFLLFLIYCTCVVPNLS